jgi:hypothetical protein
MSEPDPGVTAAAGTTVHHALVGLHALAGDLDTSALPGFRPPASAGAQLRAVAAADEREVPVSARVGVLYRLAKAGFPRYETDADAYGELATSVAQARGLDGDQLLSDLKESATEGVPFETTASGRALPHHEAAFVSSDVCTTRRVSVGGLDAVWVFSEFETDAPFEQVAEWVDPHHWPERGPMLFRSMAPVGPGQPVTIPGNLGSEHWHGVFHEEVQLVSRLNTLLHCDFWRDRDVSAGMTYDLDLSLDGQINVDRGFLLVNDLGPVRRVKALKVVGFTADVWDDVAELVCPFWTDWVRGAVRGGSTSTPQPHEPDPGEQPDAHGEGGFEPGDLLEAWVRFFGSAARDYLEMASDTGTRMRAGGYSASDWLDDGTRYWSRLAKDWARAWTYGLDALGEMAREGADAGLAPPGTDPGAARGFMTSMTASTRAASGTALPVEVTTIPVPGLSPDDQPEVSRLVSIEAGGTTLPSTDVTVTVVTLPDGSAGVRLGTTDTVVPAGLYVGVLQTAQGRPLAPVQLYVSRASGGSTP